MVIERMTAREAGFVFGPLVGAPAGDGPLSGVRLAVKDVFDVAGMRTSGGNPAWLATHGPALESAWAVDRLLDAGCSFVGKTVTDELAFSLFGTNVHYGTPRNPYDTSRIPGGSSSGSAAAVAHGFADLALGTDTAGSVRVPTSYCGVWGFRPSHGRINTSGVMALAPSFDTVGLLAASGETLASAANLLIDERLSNAVPKGILISLDLLELLGQEERKAFKSLVLSVAALTRSGVDGTSLLDSADIAEASDLFRARQLAEVWQIYGDWIAVNKPVFGEGVSARFNAAKQAVPPDPGRYDGYVSDLSQALYKHIGTDSVFALPVTPSVAPKKDMVKSEAQCLREKLFKLNCIAGLTGSPVLVVPGRFGELPFGIGLMASPGNDSLLLSIADRLAKSGWELP